MNSSSSSGPSSIAVPTVLCRFPDTRSSCECSSNAPPACLYDAGLIYRGLRARRRASAAAAAQTALQSGRAPAAVDASFIKFGNGRPAYKELVPASFPGRSACRPSRLTFSCVGHELIKRFAPFSGSPSPRVSCGLFVLCTHLSRSPRLERDDRRKGRACVGSLARRAIARRKGNRPNQPPV